MQTKPIGLAFWGSWIRDRHHLTIGDIRSVKSILFRLKYMGINVKILIEGETSLFCKGDILDASLNDASAVSAFIFVCGPLHAYGLAKDFFHAYRSVPRMAVNVSKVVADFDVLTQFDEIVWRDHISLQTFDIAIDPFVGIQPRKIRDASTIAVCLVGDQAEYGSAGNKSQATHNLIETVLREDFSIDPCFTTTLVGNRHPREIESELSNHRLLVTTRLHGSLFAIRNHLRFIAIDQVENGAKVSSIIGRELGWPFTYSIDNITRAELADAVERALLMPDERVAWYNRKATALAEASAKHTVDIIFERLDLLIGLANSRPADDYVAISDEYDYQ